MGAFCVSPPTSDNSNIALVILLYMHDVERYLCSYHFQSYEQKGKGAGKHNIVNRKFKVMQCSKLEYSQLSILMAG